MTQDTDRDDAADRALAALVRQHASRPVAPPALRARVERALAAEVGAVAVAAGRLAAWRRHAPALAAGVAGLLVTGGSVGLWLGVPASERRLAAGAVRAAQAEHARLDAAGPAEPGADPGEVGARLTAALGVPVRFGASPQGRVRVVGTSASALFGGRGVAVFLEVNGERATLSLVAGPQNFPAENRVRLARGRPYVAAVGGTRLVLWRQGPLVCALAGELAERRLTEVFRAVRPGLQVGS